MATRNVCQAPTRASIVSYIALAPELTYTEQAAKRYTELDLPEYENYETLRRQLVKAITAGSDYFGFA